MISISKIYAKCLSDLAIEDALFDEWCEGPGKEWPMHTVMMRKTEADDPKPCQEWVEGWIPAFEEWARQRRAGAGRTVSIAPFRIADV